MKSLLLKIMVIVLLVICFGGGVWKTINYIEDQIIMSAIDFIESSEFISEFREIIRDIVKDVIMDMLSQGYGHMIYEVLPDIAP